MKIPPTITQTYKLTTKDLEAAIIHWLELNNEGKASFDWQCRSRLEGHGVAEQNVNYFDGVEVTIKP